MKFDENTANGSEHFQRITFQSNFDCKRAANVEEG